MRGSCNSSAEHVYKFALERIVAILSIPFESLDEQSLPHFDLHFQQFGE